jgi:hypothetical protein
MVNLYSEIRLLLYSDVPAQFKIDYRFQLTRQGQERSIRFQSDFT